MYQEQSESNVTVLSSSNCTENCDILWCSQNSNILAEKLSTNDNPKVTDIWPTVYINPSPLLSDALSGSKDNKENCHVMKTVVKFSSKNVKIEEIQKTFAIPCSASLILNNLDSPDCVLAEVISGNRTQKEEEEVISTSPACKLINLDYDEGLEKCMKEDMNEESCEKPRSCGDSGNAEDNTVSQSSDTSKKLIDASGMAVLRTSRVLNKTFDGNDAPLAASTKTDVRQCEKTEKEQTGLSLSYEGAQLVMSSNKKELLQVHRQNDKDKGAKNIVQKAYPVQPVNMTHGEDSPFIVTEGPNIKDENIEEVFCSTFVSSQVDNSEQCSNDITTKAEDGSLPVPIHVMEKKEVRPTRATGAIPKSCGMKKKLLPPRLGPSQASKLGNKTVNLKNSKAVDATVMISSNASGAPKKQSVVDKTLQNKGRAIPRPSGLKPPNSTKPTLPSRQSEVNTAFLVPMERASLPLRKNNSTFKRPLSENDTKTVPKKTSRIPVLLKHPPPSGTVQKQFGKCPAEPKATATKKPECLQPPAHHGPSNLTHTPTRTMSHKKS